MTQASLAIDRLDTNSSHFPSKLACSETEHAWAWHGLAGLLIAAVTALHLLYLCRDCPLDLAPDEAHYWDWSRQLDWSYYSKGPLVAWLIRASIAATGEFFSSVTGSEMPAVRLPAVILSALLLMGLYVLTVQTFAKPKWAASVVACALTLPMVSAGAGIMTIDAPFLCCWSWALVWGHQVIFKRSSWAWPAVGIAVGLGILAKYTMVLWWISFVLFLLTNPRFRPLLWRPGFWAMSAVAALSCLPILIWNAHHDWVGARHVFGQAGGIATHVKWLGPAVFLATQSALLLGYWFLAWAGSLIAHAPWRESDGKLRYLWWMSVPAVAVFLLFSLRTREEPNWPVAGYLSGLVLTVSWLINHHSGWRAWVTSPTLATTLAVGAILTVFVHHTEWLGPARGLLAGEPSAACPLPLRHVDPTCRLRGWQTLAKKVDAIRGQLRQGGVEAVLAGCNWTLPGELAFYCQGHPRVYSIGLSLGDRHSQYDCWRPNPIADPEEFIGRPFILVGERTEQLADAFAEIGAPQTVTYFEQGQPIARWTITVCRRFRGFSGSPQLARY
jgi:hypothetical protein